MLKLLVVTAACFDSNNFRSTFKYKKEFTQKPINVEREWELRTLLRSALAVAAINITTMSLDLCLGWIQSPYTDSSIITC